MDIKEIQNTIDNRQQLIKEISDIIETLPEEKMEYATELFSEGSIDELFKILKEMSPNSSISKSTLKIILYLEEPSLKNKIFSELEYADFIKGLVDLYGKQSLEILPIKNKAFKVSDLDLLLVNDKFDYSNIYKLSLIKKLSNTNIDDAIKIFNDCNYFMIDKKIIMDYLDSYDNSISDKQVIKLFSALPDFIFKDEEIIVKLIEKIKNISDPSFIDHLPLNIFTPKIINELFDKAPYTFIDLYKSIPEEAKSKEFWEILCQKHKSYLREVPTNNTDLHISKEDYDVWIDKLLMNAISNAQTGDELLIALNECLNRGVLTEKKWYKILDKCIQLDYDRHELMKYNVAGFIPQIIDSSIENEEEKKLYQILTIEEKKLYQKLHIHNPKLYETLKIEMLDPKIIKIIGESSMEKIVRYSDVQEIIMSVSKDESAVKTLSFALDYLKGDNKFIEPLIERLSIEIQKLNGAELLDLISKRIDNKEDPLTEYEKTILSYLVLNPKEGMKIKKYDQIMTYVNQKNVELESIINNPNSSLEEVKSAFLDRFFGIDYDATLGFIFRYGYDSEELLKYYDGLEPDSFEKLQEKRAIEILSLLKIYSKEKNIDVFRKDFQRILSQEQEEPFKRFQVASLLETALRRAYGRELTESLSKNTGTIEIEEKEYKGTKYVVHKVSGKFDRMVHVMEAFVKSTATDADMYDKWNSDEMVNNHALCFSLIDETNPSTALGIGNTGVIISINLFSPESLSASGPQDLSSLSRKNTVESRVPSTFYTSKNMPNKTCSYSEYVIEIQDVLSGGDQYKKIQPTSIICFEEVDEKSIKAAIEFGKEIGHPIPIELIDRRELANAQMEHIKKDLNEFETGEDVNLDLIEDIVVRFNNVVLAHTPSNLKPELVENEDAPFHSTRLANILKRCISNIMVREIDGKIQDSSKMWVDIAEIIDSNMRYANLEVEKLLDELQEKIKKQSESMEESKNPTIEKLEKLKLELLRRKNAGLDSESGLETPIEESVKSGMHI